MENREKVEFFLFHTVFAIIALLGLFLGNNTHFSLLLLVIFYISSSIIFLKFRSHDLWKEAFYFSLGLNIWMLFPDWYLAAVLGTIEFPDESIRLGLVSLYMLGMWSIPFTLILFMFRILEEDYAQPTAIFFAALGGLVVFVLSEQLMPMMSVWKAKNVFAVGNIAVYVVPAEAALCCALIYGFLFSRGERLHVTLVMQFSVMVFYTGALSLSFFFIEILARNRIIQIAISD